MTTQLVAKVSDTGEFVACYRGIEIDRPEVFFPDPCAEELASIVLFANSERD